MYKIKWESKINGILLDDKINDKEEIVPPRPVFYQEMDMLGFDTYWEYPKSKKPLLWAIGRRYYHKGKFLAEAKGGNIYEHPELIVKYKGKLKKLKPINIKSLIKKNKEAIATLENEAMDFVQHAHKKHKDKVDYFSVSFSGGKDSQVVLDIVSRVLAPDEYMVIFTDTGMEIPFTHESVKKTKEKYQKLYPELKFHTAKPPKDTLVFWDKFGPPSRFQRWCCSVCKTAPFANLIRKIHDEEEKNGQPNILVFEGVRAEESDRRSEYLREAKSVKHISITNDRPLLYWNTTEIYLYLLYRNIELNEGYLHGLQRVGCSICPFASEWSEYIINFLFPELTDEYISKIKSTLKYAGLKSPNKIKHYISKGQWKKRAGGKNINAGGTSLDFVQDNQNLKAILKKPREDFFEWLNVVGEILHKKDKNNKTIGEVRIGKTFITYEVSDDKNNRVVKIKGIGDDIVLQTRLKKVLYKSAYCVHCGVCAVECPTKALKVVPTVRIDKNLCRHCSNCLDFTYKGCLVAKSINESTGDGHMKKKSSGIDRYSTFGMRKEWLEDFLNNPDGWLDKNSLGPKQKPAMRWWLKESELLDSATNNPTELCTILNNFKSHTYNLIWEIVWVNLGYGSLIVKWYVNNVSFGNYTKEELLLMLMNDLPGYAEGTLKNPRDALVNMLDKSPLGNELRLGVLTKKGNAVKLIKKIGTDQVTPIAVAYSLYKFAEDKKRYDLTVSEFYKEHCDRGPYRLFGLSRGKFEDILRYLQENKNQVVRVDLAADLDNIFLREDLKAVDILKLLTS
ncbi:phosphoadenosine phosphosulfate reductase family protein [Desulfonema magnum]|uniref:Phosphoadenosine phosphosulfate reductase domain-containing protein n=1 Tax=Desulfonema magnum TaxID=45655 RepID=A0A975BQ81_9BACT|nr:phosphoadenosine phosphosulfate reductase family protein [Desulfonema magnum]QTA89686.1 Phosphoadenosine phosphosulfate reductase domain-containing protein [Desulfonema magnum]